MISSDGTISEHHVLKGTSIIELLNQIKFINFFQNNNPVLPDSNNYSDAYIISAKMNNSYVDLKEKILTNAIIELIPIKDTFGLQVYRNTAILILTYAVYKVFGKNILNIGPSIKFNYYFDLQLNRKINTKLLNKINTAFDRIINSNLIIKPVMWPKKKAITYFNRYNPKRASQIKLLKAKKIKLFRIENFMDLYDNPLAVSTGIISQYKFISYNPGFLLEFPQVKENRLEILKLAKPNKLSKVFLETRDWYKIQEVSDVNQLNMIIRRNQLSELINISEALHQKRISQIADIITKKRKNLKVILIAGPSSSGKTTFVKRLSVQLKVNGIRPISISLDNYYLNRKQTLKDENGNYNFECLETLDLKLFNDHLQQLLKGKQIEMPVFNFYKGRRDKKRIPIKLLPNQIILIEGIHGLNEKLTFAIPKTKKFKIYISAVSQLRINNNFRIATRDTRLFRRIVRDYKFRNSTALATLKMWPNVRKGEEQYIFPFQEEANIIFNSALIYETAILKRIAYKHLKKISPKEPEHAEAERLIHLLDFFLPADTAFIPLTSIVREFLGGSSFKY